MKEIKAFVHAHRVSDVLQAIKAAEVQNIQIRNFVIFPVKALLHDAELKEARYSVDLGETVINEIKIELLCPDEAVSTLMDVIQRVGHTDEHEEGWIIVTDVISATAIGNTP